MKKYIFIIIMCLVLVPQVSMAVTPPPADDSYTLIEPLPCITGVTKGCDAGKVTPTIDIKSYILYVYKFAIAISVFLAIIMIIWGGFSYITSEVPFIKTEAKGKIEGAVSGLALVLVSYLILVTIDPRLVNIETEIPAVDMKNLSKSARDALTGYQEGLVDELKVISKEDQKRYLQEKVEIENIKKQASDLQKKIDSGELTGEEALKAKKDIEKIKIEAKERSIAQKVELAQIKGVLQYQEALRVINDSESPLTIREQYIGNTIENTLDSKGYLPQFGGNVIQATYNGLINDIKKFGADDESGVITNFDKIQTLEKQRDFFIKLVAEDWILSNNIKNGGETRTTTMGSTFKINNLPEKLNESRRDLVDEKKIKDSGLPKDQYTKIIEARINTINQALGIPEKKPVVETPPKP
jgi:hypothetical protein